MYNQRKYIQNIFDGNYSNHFKIKEMGEVFTPFDLIEEMLNKLPDDVWNDPNNTWLDPAAGLGNFHCVVVERLMVGLSEWEPNEEKRYKHIIENQLYFIELNPRSAVWIRRIFNPGNAKTRKYKMNLACADAVDDSHPGWNKIGYIWNETDIGKPTVRRKDNELKQRISERIKALRNEKIAEKELKKAKLEYERLKKKQPGENENASFYSDKQIKAGTKIETDKSKIDKFV